MAPGVTTEPAAVAVLVSYERGDDRGDDPAHVESRRLSNFG